MAAESRSFSTFDGTCSDLSSGLGLPNRSAFGLPVPPSPFVAHFYPMVNSVGPAPPLQSPDPTHISTNPGSIFPAGRPDFLYTELYRNLLKSASKHIADGTKNFPLYSNGRGSLVGKEAIDLVSKGRKGETKDFSDSNVPRSHVGTPLSSPFVPSSLRSFYEGIYTQFNPNHSDYLLRIRAEQQLAIKKSQDFRQKGPSPYLGSCDRPFSGAVLDFPSAFKPSRKPNRVSSSPPRRNSHRHSAFENNISPTSGCPSQNSPVTSDDYGHVPLDYTCQKLPRSPFDSAKYSPTPRGNTPRLNVSQSTHAGVEGKRIGGERLENFNPIASEMPSTGVNMDEDCTPSPRNGDDRLRASGPDTPPNADNAQTKFGGNVSSSSSSTVTDLTLEVTVPFEVRMKRKRRLTSSVETCPVCGVTVRATEMKQHFAQEVARLEKITQDVFRNSRRHSQERKSSGSSVGCIAGTSVTPTTSKKQGDYSGQHSLSKGNRLKTFQKVRGNRVDRFNSRVGRGQSTLWRNGTVPGGMDAVSKLTSNAWGQYNQNILVQNKMRMFGNRFENVRCPACNISLSHMTNHDQISDHVVSCAGAMQNGNSARVKDEKMEEVDVEAADDRGAFGEEYEWCGETRVRATAMVHRDLLASTPGFQVIKSTENDDSDQDLNVETDETGEFGGAQFTENDLVAPCQSDEEAMASNSNNNLQAASPSNDSSNSEARSLPCPSAISQSPSVVVQALRLKIQELENEKRSNRCLICMEPHKDPLVSIQCWHVHCHKCWMRALGVKKLCPQCNMITPASQLRRIYL